MIAVMREVRNFFTVSSERGRFTIDGDSITLTSPYLVGQYILVAGSILNDGVYKVTAKEGGVYTLDRELTNEEFDGVVYGLRVPPDFVALCGQIDEYNEKTPYTSKISESIGGYSYSMATDSKGSLATWQSTFSRQLAPYRRMFSDIDV